MIPTNATFDKQFAAVFGNGTRRGEYPVVSAVTDPSKRQYHGYDSLTAQCRTGRISASSPSPASQPVCVKANHQR